MSGWIEISCEEREALIDRLGRSYNGFSKESGIGPHSGSTDTSPGGLIFTEWGYRDGDQRAVLRDYRWNADHFEGPGSGSCRHEVPACEDCGYPDGSFACKIRHISVQTGWAKKDH